jgi:hypothetical protein|tara:strand:+ start:242 stop:364 length:123 start_codon:yes stop_codon:yes gene_type:complete
MCASTHGGRGRAGGVFLLKKYLKKLKRKKKEKNYFLFLFF